MLALLDQEQQPTDEDVRIAREALATLRPMAEAGAAATLHVMGKGDVAVPLPAIAVAFVVDFLTALVERKPLSVIPHTAELTTQQAADVLNVSRPFLVKLLDRGDIPHRVVGTHRRVLASELVAYKKRSDEARQRAIAHMVAVSQKLGVP